MAQRILRFHKGKKYELVEHGNHQPGEPCDLCDVDKECKIGNINKMMKLCQGGYLKLYKKKEVPVIKEKTFKHKKLIRIINRQKRKIRYQSKFTKQPKLKVINHHLVHSAPSENA